MYLYFFFAIFQPSGVTHFDCDTIDQYTTDAIVILIIKTF